MNQALARMAGILLASLLAACAGPMKIAPEELEKMIHESLDQSAASGPIKQLYDKYYPEAKGEIEYDVTIDQSGKLATAFLINSTLSDPKFQSSLLTVLKEHKLDIRIKNRFKVRHQFTFN